MEKFFLLVRKYRRNANIFELTCKCKGICQLIRKWENYPILTYIICKNLHLFVMLVYKMFRTQFASKCRFYATWSMKKWVIKLGMLFSRAGILVCHITQTVYCIWEILSLARGSFFILHMYLLKIVFLARMSQFEQCTGKMETLLLQTLIL